MRNVFLWLFQEKSKWHMQWQRWVKEIFVISKHAIVMTTFRNRRQQYAAVHVWLTNEETKSVEERTGIVGAQTVFVSDPLLQALNVREKPLERRLGLREEKKLAPLLKVAVRSKMKRFAQITIMSCVKLAGQETFQEHLVQNRIVKRSRTLTSPLNDHQYPRVLTFIHFMLLRFFLLNMFTFFFLSTSLSFDRKLLSIFIPFSVPQIRFSN